MDKKIKVAIISFPLNVFGGGFDIFKNWLTIIDKNKYEVHFITCSSRWDEMKEKLNDIDSIHVININELSSFKSLYIPGIIKLTKYFKKNKIDIVHTSMLQADIIGGIAAKISGVPILVSTVIGYLINTSQGGIGKIKTILYKISYSAINNWFDKIMAISEATAEELIKDFGVPKKQIEVNYCGIELQRELKWNSENRKNSNLKVGAIGELKYAKGMSFFIEAIPDIIENYSKVNFIVAGDGPEKNVLELRARELGIDKKVDFLGWVNNPREVIKDMDIFVFPSLPSYDGLPRVILEAWAMGTTVVATRVACVPELFDGKNKGITINPGNPKEIAFAVNTLIDNQNKAKEMSKNAFNEINKFDVKREVYQIELTYKDLISKKGFYC